MMWLAQSNHSINQSYGCGAWPGPSIKRSSTHQRKIREYIRIFSNSVSYAALRFSSWALVPCQMQLVDSVREAWFPSQEQCQPQHPTALVLYSHLQATSPVTLLWFNAKSAPPPTGIMPTGYNCKFSLAEESHPSCCYWALGGASRHMWPTINKPTRTITAGRIASISLLTLCPQ